MRTTPLDCAVTWNQNNGFLFFFRTIFSQFRPKLKLHWPTVTKTVTVTKAEDPVLAETKTKAIHVSHLPLLSTSEKIRLSKPHDNVRKYCCLFAVTSVHAIFLAALCSVSIVIKWEHNLATQDSSTKTTKHLFVCPLYKLRPGNS